MLRPIRRTKKKNFDPEEEANLVRDRCSVCNKIILTTDPNLTEKLCDPCARRKAAKLKHEQKVISKNSTNNTNQNQKITNQNQKRNVSQPAKRPVIKTKPQVNLVDVGKSIAADSPPEKRRRRRDDTVVPKVLPCKLGSFSVLHKVSHNGFLYSIADIVSLQSSSRVYYAQIRIFIEDSFCEKYAALIWLLPTSSTSDKKCGFDPETYTYGPQDEWFYNVKELKFVMHPPTDYYRRFISPVPKTSEIVPVVKSKFRPTFKRKL